MVRYLTTNGKPDAEPSAQAFALRYRRVNATFYVAVKRWLFSFVVLLAFQDGKSSVDLLQKKNTAHLMGKGEL